MSNGKILERELPGVRGLAARKIMQILARAGSKGRSFGALAKRLEGLDEELMKKALEDLQTRGEAVQHEGSWIAVSASDWKVAIVDGTEGGDVLLRAERDRQPRWFARRRRSAGALEGDRVLIDPQAGGRPHGSSDLEQAVVVRILNHGYPRLVGMLEIDEENRRWLQPFDPQIELEVEVHAAEEVQEGVYVVVELTRSGEATRHPRGRVVEVLGHPETPGVDVLVVLRHYGIPEDFPEEVIREADSFPADPDKKDTAGREDLTDRMLVTIDGASARDFDDAVSIERLPKGGYRLGVHIADVAHYVREGGDLDQEAYRRGTSVYYPDRAVPMLPENLSNGLCSLKPDVRRLAMSVFLDLDEAGEVQSRRFVESVIRSKRRLTYEEVRRILEEPADGDAKEYGEDLLGDLRTMAELAGILYRRRRARGSLDFDLPAGDVILDTDGYTVGIRPGERTVAHRLIEDFMIAANEAVAEALDSREIPALYRVHDAPPEAALEDLAELLKGLGIRLKGDFSDLPPGALQEVLAEVEGRPEEEFVSSVVLRSLARAFYSPECNGHYALAASYYCHFTSPIRRYPDLVVHRSLKGLIRGSAPGAAPGGMSDGQAAAFLAARLPEIAEHSSRTERRAERSERELLQWKKVRFLSERVGETFPGRITGVAPFGLFVQLEELFVDGLVAIRTMEDDYYRFEPEAHRLVGQDHGRVFRLGDAVQVILSGVSERHRGLDLRLTPEMTSGRRSSRRSDRGSSDRGSSGKGGAGRGRKEPSGRRRGQKEGRKRRK